MSASSAVVSAVVVLAAAGSFDPSCRPELVAPGSVAVALVTSDARTDLDANARANTRAVTRTDTSAVPAWKVCRRVLGEGGAV